jgi:peptide/nickel transport system substrate-binding protein
MFRILPGNSLLSLLLALPVIGCGAAEDEQPSATSEQQSIDEPFQLGDLLVPFDPPPLAELERTIEWIDRPVLDGMEVMRRKQEAAGPPPLTVDEAMALRNDSPETNAKILETLGRLAPADGAGVDYDATWVRHSTGELKSSNPLLLSSYAEFEYQALAALGSLHGILVYDQQLSWYAPKAAIVSWQTSTDYLIDKLVLREDLTWSDGKPLTAHDFVFSFQVIMSDAVIIHSVRQGTDHVRWVEAYDDHTVVIFHKEALATNTENIAFPIIPKHIYETTIPRDPTMARSAEHSRLEDHPVVSGPYQLVSRVRNQEFVLRRRESYYLHNGRQVRPKPYFREIRVKVIPDFNTAMVALKGGQIEDSIVRPEQWVTQTNDEDFYQRNTKVTALEWTEFHFTWNTQTLFFADRRVREAMSWALDYEELLKVVCHGMYEQGRGPFHPTSWMFPKNGPQPFHQDLDRAEALLDQAGWTDSDGDGIRDKQIDGRRVPFRFTMLTFQTESGVMAATLMKMCLDQIGIICNVKPTEFTVLVDSTQKHKFEAAMGGWGAGTDPDSSSNMYVTGEARNYGQYSNRQVDELYERGRRELDRKKRAAIYGQIHNLIWHDQPYTWLFYRNAFYGFSKKLRGYNFAPTGPYYFDPGISSIYKPLEE